MAIYRYGYKVLGPGRSARMGVGSWPEEGQWTDRIDDPQMCSRGWHIIPDKESVRSWVYHTDDDIYIVEYRVKDVAGRSRDKLVVKQARLVEKVPLPKVTFAADENLINEYKRVDKSLVEKSRSKKVKDAYAVVEEVMDDHEKFDRSKVAKALRDIESYLARVDRDYWYQFKRSDGLEERRNLGYDIHNLLNKMLYISSRWQRNISELPDLPPDRVVKDKLFDIVVQVEAENVDEALALARSHSLFARRKVKGE